MKKKIFSFYDLLLIIISSFPMLAYAFFVTFRYDLRNAEWCVANWPIVLVLAICCALPTTFVLFALRFVDIENDAVYFHYNLFLTTTLEKDLNSIDQLWNQRVDRTTVDSVEVVKLTEQELREKVYYRHWFNKYLKINLHYGKTKYVYIANYSNRQIKKIIRILTSGY